MDRKNMDQILHEARINPAIEYMRLHDMFYKFSYEFCDEVHLYDACKDSFWDMPFRGTCISIADYNDYYGFAFQNDPHFLDFNEFLLFCEYSYNLLLYARLSFGGYHIEEPKKMYFDQLTRAIDNVGYMFVRSSNGMMILVQKDIAAISVAEITDTNTSSMVMEYNHHTLKGNLTKKKTILKFLADDLEPKRKVLASINKSLSETLFQMFHRFIRHNNQDNSQISTMTDDEIEGCYDDIYQLWLLAKLEIDNLERKKRAETILQKVNQ